mmetsp:Transcript_10666/g.26116  ORF Transcript_10666/g.26116 Transcript_10666/m.26116 type:complete len:219 (-) Transcript_10666:1367-2023(-)
MEIFRCSRILISSHSTFDANSKIALGSKAGASRSFSSAEAMNGIHVFFGCKEVGPRFSAAVFSFFPFSPSSTPSSSRSSAPRPSNAANGWNTSARSPQFARKCSSRVVCSPNICLITLISRLCSILSRCTTTAILFSICSSRSWFVTAMCFTFEYSRSRCAVKLVCTFALRCATRYSSRFSCSFLNNSSCCRSSDAASCCSRSRASQSWAFCSVSSTA